MSKLKESRQQILGLSYNETQQQIKEQRRKLFELRLQQQRGEVKNSRVFAETRKSIARLLHHLTVLESQ